MMNREWHEIALAPTDEVVETKIDDEQWNGTMSANLVKDLRSKWDIRDWARGKMKLAADRIEELEFRETAHLALLKTLDEQEKRIAELEAALMDENNTNAN